MAGSRDLVRLAEITTRQREINALVDAVDDETLSVLTAETRALSDEIQTILPRLWPDDD